MERLVDTNLYMDIFIYVYMYKCVEVPISSPVMPGGRRSEAVQGAGTQDAQASGSFIVSK